jgi:3-hydroxybutyryl-CoA dehydratase
MADITRQRGLTFEEFELGDVAESVARTITEADIVLFAALSGDYNQVHTDAEFAKGTIFGQRVAHGLLGLSVASGLAWRTGFLEGTGEALMGVDWKFRGPVLIGDTIRLRAEVSQKKEMRRLGGGIVVFAVTLLNQRDEVVQKGSWTLLVRGQGAEQSGRDD